MKIEVTHKAKGNPRHGDHDVDTTIRFDYAGSDTWLVSNREMEIVRAIVPEDGMWWNVKDAFTELDGTRLISSTYVINHGYDSGD